MLTFRKSTILSMLAAAFLATPLVWGAAEPASFTEGTTPQEQALLDKLAEPGEDLEINESRNSQLEVFKKSRYYELLVERNPEFIYEDVSPADPMLMPWTRAQVMSEEYIRRARRALESGNINVAEAAFRMVLRIAQNLADMGIRTQPFDELTAEAQDGLAAVAAERERLAEQEAFAEGRVIELPPWVKTNTNGIIFDPAGPYCLVGPYTLSLGDLVPRQPVPIRVAKIEPNAVHYQVEDQIFVVSVEEGE